MAQKQDFSAYTIQVTAVLCFILLVVCYIAFIAPLLWLDIEKNIALGIYGIMVSTNLLLFIRFVNIDPCDPKIIKLQHNFMKNENQSFIEHNWSICYLYANCCYPHDNSFFDKTRHQPIVEEEMMFCTLCKAEVGKSSKHCKACDKCIEGFDHHCWLTLEFLIGIFVIIRTIVDFDMAQDIHVKFGNQITKTSVIVVTVIFTIIPMTLSYPVGELFFFHILLIKKGITTYEYIMTARAQVQEKDKSDATEEKASETTPKKKNIVKISPWDLAKFNA